MMLVISKFNWLLILTFTLFQCKNDEPIDINHHKQNSSIEKLMADTTHTVAYLMGHFDPASHALFSQIEIKYADREGMYMRTEAYKAFQNMWEAASNEGIILQIRSASRNFNYQKGLWENKWNGETILSDGVDASEIKDEKERALKILLYSSMPGTSRHHWGTDIDLNSFSNKWFETGDGSDLYDWLISNAHSFGFCQVYTAKGDERPNGYEEEKWHWSFSPISKPLTQYAKGALRNKMIEGFEGANTATMIDVVNNYVLGIHPSCLD